MSPEPAVTITEKRLTPADIGSEDYTIDRSTQVKTAYGDPMVDSWGFITGYKSHLVVLKDGKPLLEFHKGALVVLGADLNLKQVARALNQLKMHYYGWPIKVSVKKDELMFRCRDYDRAVTPHSTPLRYPKR